ncbi:MAG TPA: porin family protein [Chitinophagaceae bacterium]|nr:porin family protein [Chitinophagaceae bacterium]
MKAKNLVIAIAAILFSGAIYAQSATTFGIRAGVNFQNLTGEDFDGDKLENKLKTGFHAGLNAEIPVGIDFFVQPGVLFSTKGAKVFDSDDKVNLSYIEVPVNFVYKPELGTGRLILGFGPYAAFAIGGQYKPENGNDIDIEFENEITAAQAISGVYFKRFDAGANLLFGYEFANKLSVQLNGGLGLVNINPKVEGLSTDSKTKNTGFGVSLGYRFGQ